jgi:hypothetical protein
MLHKVSIKSRTRSPERVKNEDTHKTINPIVNSISPIEISHPMRTRSGIESQFGIIFNSEYPLALQRNPRNIGYMRSDMMWKNNTTLEASDAIKNGDPAVFWLPV